MSLLTVGIPVLRSRRVDIGETVFTGETGAVVHPITYEHFAALGSGEPPIDDWEALRHSVAREFDKRWQAALRKRMVAA